MSSWILALDYPGAWIEHDGYRGSYLTLQERRRFVDLVNAREHAEIPIIESIAFADPATAAMPMRQRILHAEQLGTVGRAMLDPLGDVYLAADPASLLEERPQHEFAAITGLLQDAARTSKARKTILAVEYVPSDWIDRWGDNEA